MAKVRVSDIAQSLGISPSTVSRALNNHPKISTQTKKKIVDKAHEMGYFDSETQTLSAFPYKTTALLYPVAASDLMQDAVNMLTIAEQYGYAVSLFPIPNSSYVKLLTKMLLEKQYQSVISFFPCTDTVASLEALESKGLRVVLINPENEKTYLPQVNIDIYSASYEAFEHLVLMAGTNIAMVGTPLLPSIHREIERAYMDVLNRNGVQYNPECIYNETGNLEDLHRWIFSLLDFRRDISGLFTASNHHMLQVVSSLRDLGRKIPRDVKVISLSYSDFPNFLSPKITSCDFKMESILCECFIILSGGSVTDCYSGVNDVKYSFVLRKSTL
ncbi:LacI family transcriptional regulator [Halosquirtibacter laminarini]|uniref:LacI family transcriptional regulator n=1 Tax=Halosquirtibacter laminarini TaxID=3374600 RepID=A0AC61NJF1_9BACT|nr:LacI family transcriptional regulator [Prolixibacteraceae bacterium]